MIGSLAGPSVATILVFGFNPAIVTGVAEATGDYAGQDRRLAGNAGADGAQNAGDHGFAARLRDRAAHRADQRRPPRRELWNPLSGSAQVGAGGIHLRGVGRFRQQPQGQVLLADARRTETSAAGGAAMGRDDDHSPGTRHGGLMRMLRAL